ncbi:MAG: hypothetical protein LBK66_14750 [Spirochaetaceae bacterium]|nr:hypothetical protein [Spirochaetaceae bacterium]
MTFSPAEGIEVEIPQYRHGGTRNWSGKPGFLRFCRKKCAQKPNIKQKIACQSRMPIAIFGPEGTE